MALSDLKLAAGQVVVSRSDSTLGILGVQVAMNFGTVQLVNQLSDTYSIGTRVIISADLEKVKPFMVISGTYFYLLNESDLSGIEPPPV